MKKLIALLLSMLLMVAVFAPSVAEEQIVIKLSCAASEQEKISCEQTVARFEEKYPNVKVEAEYYAGLSWDEIIQKQLVEFAAGTQADVVYIAIEGTHLMVEYDLFQPITDLIEANKDYFAEVPQSAFDAFKVGDEYYEVPFNCNDMAIAYNTEMFDAIGVKPGKWTAQEYLDALGKIDAKYNTPETPITEKVWGTVIGETPYLWMAAFGASVLNEDWTASNMKDPLSARFCSTCMTWFMSMAMRRFARRTPTIPRCSAPAAWRASSLARTFCLPSKPTTSILGTSPSARVDPKRAVLPTASAVWV